MTGKGSFVCICLGSFDHLHQLFNSKWACKQTLAMWLFRWCKEEGNIDRNNIIFLQDFLSPKVRCLHLGIFLPVDPQKLICRLSNCFTVFSPSLPFLYSGEIQIGFSGAENWKRKLLKRRPWGIQTRAGTIQQFLRIADSWFMLIFPKRIAIQWIDSISMMYN